MKKIKHFTILPVVTFDKTSVKNWHQFFIKQIVNVNKKNEYKLMFLKFKVFAVHLAVI